MGSAEGGGFRGRRSVRLRNFDYAGNATYFVTICTRGRVDLFGEVEDGLVVLNEVGSVVEREWLRSSLMRAELELHSFVVMPNHLHGLLTITPAGGAPAPDVGSVDVAGVPRPRQAPRSLGSFVAGFKAATFREVEKLTGVGESIWQRGYYEHVVRDERDFQRIVEYMASNPFDWERDRENADRVER